MIRVIIQIMILCLFNETGKWIADFFHIPIPGSIIGMMMLFSLLLTGVFKEKILIEGANFFLKYFSFFFLPLSVSAMALGPYLSEFGGKLILILLISVLAGLTATSAWTQRFIRIKEKKAYDSTH
ncbi:CidA/LrgA family protein [Lysinibacillus sphaericus]